MNQEREVRSHTGMKRESGYWEKQGILGYHGWVCKYNLVSNMKAILSCAKEIGRELAALWRVETNWEMLKAKTERGHCHCAAEKDRGQLQTWWRAGCRLRSPGKLRAAGSCQQLEISEVSWPEVWIKCVSMAQYEIAKFHPRLGMHQHPQHHDRQHSHRVTGSRLVGMDLRLTHRHPCHWVSASCWRLRTGWWEASPPALQATMKWGGIFLTWSFPESGVAFCSPGGPRAESWPW